MIRITFLAFAFFMSLASAGFSSSVTLSCVMTDLKRAGGWVPQAAIIKVDTASKAVQLVRPTAKQLNGKLRSQKLVRNNAKKMILKWEVSNTKSRSNQVATTFRFRLSIDKASGKASVIAKPVGYGNDFRASGDCKFG